MAYKKPIFEGVPQKNVNKSLFNLSHEWKCAYVPGYLQPVLLLETLPGDEWKINSEFYFRFAPMYFPIMQRFTMRCNYFKIPNRILWPYSDDTNPGWEKWIAELHEFPHPTCEPNCGVSSAGDQFNYSVASKFGLPELTYTPPPTGLETTVGAVNAFPFSAYLKIWDWYYRIPQLEDERWFKLEQGDNTANFNAAWGSNGNWLMFSSKWEQDYFTAALPTPQVGDAITIPSVGTDANGNPIASNTIAVDDGGNPTNQNLYTLNGKLVGASNSEEIAIENTATIRDLRLAETLQHYYERIMKVGQRYRDFIKGLFGNDPQPGLIDAPVLLGSKFGRVQISDVLTQADTIYSEGTDRQTGDYAGQANLYSHDNDMIDCYCEEHGWIMAILELNPNTSYGQGVHRMWRKSVQTDYALDLFAGIGDQEILKEEVYFSWPTADAAKNQDTFGYIPRFSEYRYQPNMAVSEMQRGSGLSQHMGRHWDGTYMGSGGGMDDLSISNAFTNVAFTTSNFEPNDNADNGHIRNVDVFRVMPSKPDSGVSLEGIVWCHIYHEIYVKRNLPFFSTPKL